MKTQPRYDLLSLGTFLLILVALGSGVATVGGMLSPTFRELHLTWWFRALLAWGCVALAVCGLRALVELCASARGNGLRGRRPSGTVLVEGLRGLTAERVHSRFREFGYHVCRWDAGGDRVVEGVKGWVGWAGRGLLHCGLAAVLLGGGVEQLLGRSEKQVVAAGERFVIPGGGRAPVVLTDDIYWEPNAGRARLQVVRPQEEDVTGPRWLNPGEALKVHGREVRLLSIGPSAQRFRSAKVRAKRFDGWEQLLELPADIPVPLNEGDSVTAVAYVALDAPNRGPEGPALHLRVISGGSTSAIWVTPWEGFGGVAGPWRFTLASVVPEPEATFVVRTVPGDSLVASGLVIFAVGVVCSVSRPLRRTWAIITPSGSATLGAHGPLAGRLWREEVGRLAGGFTHGGGDDTGECP